jgi:putative ABC transport system permease protein
MAFARQYAAVTRWNLRNAMRNFQNSAVIVLGFFGVILVFVSVLAIRDGLVRSLSANDPPDLAYAYARSGSLSDAAFALAQQAPGLAKGGNGAMVSGTLLTEAEIPRWGQGQAVSVLFRGVDQNYPAVMSHFRIVEGRMFHPGVNEIVIGRMATGLFDHLHVGQTVVLDGRDWTVTGVFTTDSNVRDSSILGDIHQVRSLLGGGTSYSSFYLRMASPASFPALKNYLQSNPQIDAAVETLATFDALTGGTLSPLLLAANGVITLLMALGAIFSALNVMYANIARRMTQIATMRALGFGRLPVLFAILTEVVLLAIIGWVLGVAVPLLTLNGMSASTSTNGAFTGFQLSVTLDAIALALALTLVMAVIGGIFPSLRAARVPIAQALHA